MSILVMTTITGTFRARAIPRCSLISLSVRSMSLGQVADILAHANETIIGSYHKQAIIGATA